MKHYLVRVYESGTANPHTAEFEIVANDFDEALTVATEEGAKLGYNADDMGQPEEIEAQSSEPEQDTINLSDMEVGDKAEYNGDIVELRDGGESGGTEYDLYLAYIGHPSEFIETYPALIVDREDVSL